MKRNHRCGLALNKAPNIKATAHARTTHESTATATAKARTQRKETKQILRHCTRIDPLLTWSMSHSVTAVSQRRETECTGVCQPLKSRLTKRDSEWESLQKHPKPLSPNHGSVLNLLLKDAATTIKASHRLYSRRGQRRKQLCQDVRQYLLGGHEHHEEDMELSRETVLIITFATYAQGCKVTSALDLRTSCPVKNLTGNITPSVVQPAEDMFLCTRVSPSGAAHSIESRAEDQQEPHCLGSRHESHHSQRRLALRSGQRLSIVLVVAKRGTRSKHWKAEGQ